MMGVNDGSSGLGSRWEWIMAVGDRGHDVGES